MMIKRNILYVAVLVLFLLLALYSGNTVFYMITYTMLLLPVSSLLHVLLIRFRLQYFEQADKVQILRGEAIRYSLTVCNRDVIFYPDLKVNYDADSHFYKELQDSQSFFVGPLGKYTVQKSLVCRHIGNYEIGIESVELRDFFGFFKLVCKKKNSSLRIMVMPKVYQLTSFGGISANRGEVFQSGKRGSVEDYSELEEIRKFTPGLPLKSVHWKLSAKRNELMARKFAVQQSRLVYLYADVEGLSGEDEASRCQRDILIEAILAIARYCIQKGVPTAVHFNDEAMSSIKIENRQDFNMLYGKLFQMPMQHGPKLANMLKLNTDKHMNVKDMVVLAASLDESLFDSLVKAKLSQKNLGLVYLRGNTGMEAMDEAYDPSVMFKGLHDYKIKTYDIGSADEIKEVLEKQG